MLRTLSSPSPAGISIKFFGITNGQALNHSFIQMPLTVSHTNKFPINRKVAYPNLNHGGFICSSSPRSSSGDTSASSSDGNPSTFQPLKHFSGPSLSRRVDEDIDGKGIPVPSTFDFLELKRELEKEEKFRTGSEKEELLSNSDKEEIVVGSPRVRGGRQVMRRSNLLAKQVICIESARSLGFVSQLWVDTKLWVVALVEVRPSFLSGDTEKFLLEDVYQVGDVLLVSDEPLMENELKMTGLDTLVGYDVVKPGRRGIGKIRGYTFNINTGVVEALEFDSFGFSIIPSSLVSTYRLSVEDVLDVESDKVIVYKEALSHVQRLTKGIWDSGSIGRSKEHLESRDLRRKREYFDRRSRSQRPSRPKFPDEVRDEDDDWDFPLDY
ncbi:hypothetical protein KSP39_PZI009662 [Platanthera zijinensis]|uniref:PRC-barrel domain-containing protein n=1 Tax=Platanthera zijinensis TaxID=2320716 RepID=A0AAP0G7P0_9ASPA